MNETKNANQARKAIGDVAPQLAALTDDVLFGQVWEDTTLSKRDRSLITCAALVAAGKVEQLNFHMPFALQNGVSKEELTAMVTHLAFYAGWPSAMSAIAKLRELP